MDMNEPNSIEITSLISAFVDRIEQVLLSRGIPRGERTNICQEVEAQIHMLIERRIESGAELNIDLVNGIIESMDPPESYSPETLPTVEPIIEPVLQTGAALDASKQPAMPKTKPSVVDTVRKYLDRPKRTTPALDWVAICGLVATCFGLFLVVVRPGRGDGAAIFGVFFIVSGVTASVFSFWRIRHSNGLLTGQRIASIGVLMLPFLLVNALFVAILFATRFGIVLGVLTVVVMLIYGNYYLLQHALRWLSVYSVKTADSERIKPEVMADNGVLSGVAN